MKVYIAKDWTGSKVFKEPPHLIKCGGAPDIENKILKLIRVNEHNF